MTEASGAPKLLSGGNPQIAKGDGEGPVAAYIAAMPGWKRAVGERLDALVTEAVPEVRKGVRWNSPFYGRPEGGWIVTFHCLTTYVKVTFFDGASLEPLPPVAFKDPKARAIDLREGEEIDEEQFRSWCRQAAELPGWTP